MGLATSAVPPATHPSYEPASTPPVRRGFSGSARRFARSIARGASRLPWLEGVAGGLYARYFDRASGHIRLFRGIYPDFETAARHLPADRPVGYDNEASATRVLDEFREIYEYDYPIMFWLGKLLPDTRRIFDWGGNVGLKFYSYDAYLSYPEGLRWDVCEVPAVADAGRAIAAREGAHDLHFTTELDALPAADILLAAGSLHFMEDPFARLREAASLPKHLLLCKVPVYDQPTAVTLSNMGTAICLYRLYNRSEFVRSVETLGYRLIDEWRTSDGYCSVPFHPERAIKAYSGFYFERHS